MSTVIVSKPTQDLQKFLKSDRQWPRHLRIHHAQTMLDKAKTGPERDFWKQVLDANGTLTKDDRGYWWAQRGASGNSYAH